MLSLPPTALAALAIAIGAPGVARAADPVELPATPAGRVAEAFFEAFNSADEATLIAYEEAHRHPEGLERRPAPERATQLLGAHAQVGDLTPGAILESSPVLIRVAAEASNIPIWLEIKFEVEPEEPHRIVSSLIQPTSAPSVRITIDDEWADLPAMLERLRTETGAPAIAAAIVKDGEIIDRAIVGVRAVGTDDTAQIDDRFHMGSITKSMTATLIAQLIEQDALAWDTTLAHSLSGVPMLEAYEPATVENLLHHRAGLHPYTTFDAELEAYFAGVSGPGPVQHLALARRALGEEPQAPIGEQMLYSNAGYTIAGVVAERTTGESWAALMQESVFAPAGMTSAGFGWPASRENPHQPRGHFTEEDGSLRPRDWDEYPFDEYLAPAGNVHCSITDLARYAIFHLEGLQGESPALTQQTFARLHTAPELNDNGSGYAAGWRISRTPGLGAKHDHSGSGGTFFATVELYPEAGCAIVVATNFGLEGQAVSEAVSEMVRKRYFESATE